MKYLPLRNSCLIGQEHRRQHILSNFLGSSSALFVCLVVAFKLLLSWIWSDYCDTVALGRTPYLSLLLHRQFFWVNFCSTQKLVKTARQDSIHCKFLMQRKTSHVVQNCLLYEALFLHTTSKICLRHIWWMCWDEWKFKNLR